MIKVKIKLIKSIIGASKRQKRTVQALGLRKINSVSIQELSGPIKGMINKVNHIISVEEIK